jgi:hypothetical protein
MEASELRIGNVIMYHGSIAFITSLGEFGLTAINKEVTINCLYNAMHLFPIPITEEIFLRAGFEKNEYDELILGNIGFGEVGGDLNQFQLILGKRCQPIIIKYVHKLQNIYFELKGEELKIEI